MNQSSELPAGRAGRDWAWPALFVAVLLVHLLLVTRGWFAGALSGHEFRQAQTAISAHFIQVDNDFSIAYPTPILGRPWSIPMEFPLYQWAVVGVSNVLELPLPAAGRTVSLACFHLMLPALYLLMARFGVARGARWLGLALVAACPLYIFYTRAFLIESMALMFATWFLAAFVAAMQTGRAGWMLVASGAGVAAALVKVTTLMLWMTPAAGYGFYQLYLSKERGRAAFFRTLGRGALLAAGPGVAAIWWVHTADAIKALNPAAGFLVSGSMREFNFGLWTDRFSVKIWADILAQMNVGVMPWWLACGGIAIIIAAPASCRALARWGAVAVLTALLLFPRLFAWHDYYFYAIASLWLGTVAVALHGLLDRPGRRVWGALVIGGVLAAQWQAYGRSYYQIQVTSGNGGTGLTDTLRVLTPRHGVLIIAGNDWNAMVPYYAQRRALMLRVGTEYDLATLAQSFARLAGEEIAAFVVSGDQRKNEAMIALVIATFDLHPQAVFSHFETEVYLPRGRRDWALAKLRATPISADVVPQGEALEHAPVPEMDRNVRKVNPHTDRELFGHMTPMPVRYHFSFDANAGVLDGHRVIGAHPDAEIWFAAPQGFQEISCTFGIFAGAYERTEGTTDGVEFIIIENRPDGTTAEIFRRKLEPSGRSEDRGMQKQVLSCRIGAGSEVVFMTRAGGDFAFDWAYWGPITLR